jgi:hypothetical protein
MQTCWAKPRSARPHDPPPPHPAHQRRELMSYDPKCEELARYFLPSDIAERLIESLAQRIQDFIEDELADMEREARIGDGETGR